uniref:Glutathione S-transferase LANCL1 n=1 Tax=Neogobius melanostomus TaxID=47308 RepID=A0A8C6U1F3_9GOBI
MDTRALRNPYADYDGNPLSTQSLFDFQGRLTPEFSQRVSGKISELLAVMENGLKSADPRDCTAYTGWAGVALLYLHLHKVFSETSFLHKAHEYVCRSLQCLTRRHDVTFLCGDTGPLAVAAAVYHRLQRPQEADDCVNRLMQYYETVVKGSGGLPDELLYGRVGYLYSLLFINQQFGQDKIPLDYIQQVPLSFRLGLFYSFSLTLRRLCSGRRGCDRVRRAPEQEVPRGEAESADVRVVPGAVRGSGARARWHLLLPHAARLGAVCGVPAPTGEAQRGPRVRTQAPHRKLPPLHRGRAGPAGALVPRLPGGRLHAAAGLQGVWQPGYLDDALQCGEVVWRYGLLKKGYGLCHGAAGNAYTFLTLYRHTQDPKHLFRACMFADWCMNYGRHGCRTPDTPFSLFEGMAGTIYFLADFLQPMRAKFPAFEV